jgi:hypothetical protein
MTLRKRIDRLEARHGTGGEILRVTRIIFAAARREGGEIVSDAVSAMVQASNGWETIERRDGEPEAAFLERIDVLAEASLA